MYPPLMTALPVLKLVICPVFMFAAVAFNVVAYQVIVLPVVAVKFVNAEI